MRTLGPLIVLACLASRSTADKNVTIDDFDRSRIQYLPSDKWMAASDYRTPDRYKMTTTYTLTQGTFATFAFSGATAFYYMGYGAIPIQGPLGTIEIEFNGQKYEVPENIDITRQAQQILFSQTGLDPTIQYSFLVRKTSAAGGGHDLNVDAMIYTVPDGSTTVNNEIGKGAPIGTIVGGILGGACFGVLIVCVWLWLRYKRKNKRRGRLPAPPSLVVRSPSTLQSLDPTSSLHSNRSYMRGPHPGTVSFDKHARTSSDAVASIPLLAYSSSHSTPPQPLAASSPMTSVSTVPLMYSHYPTRIPTHLEAAAPPPYSD